jgi:hypothetical protein
VRIARTPLPTLQSPPQAAHASAVSSRGLGHSPLKAGTRVRIPLPLLTMSGEDRLHKSGRWPEANGPFVYRLGRHPFTVQRGVRFPYGLLVTHESLFVISGLAWMHDR